MECAKTALLVAFMERLLKERDKELVKAHVSECARCSQLLRQLTHVRARLILSRRTIGQVLVDRDAVRRYVVAKQATRVQSACSGASVYRRNAKVDPEGPAPSKPIVAGAGETLPPIRGADPGMIPRGGKAEGEPPAARSDVEGPRLSTRANGERSDRNVIADWAAHMFALRDEAGLVIDSGATCQEVWRKILDQVELGRCIHMLVYTNSYLVLEEWCHRLSNSHVLETKVELYGTSLDPKHLALYGSDHNIVDVADKLMSGDFQPMQLYIGTSGIRFTSDGRILFGYNAGPQELVVKKLLFQRPTDIRIIVAAASKIGFTGGRTFDILDVNKLGNAPIYLVTTNPPDHSPDTIRRFEEALGMFLSQTMEEAVRAHEGLEFHWIIVDRNSGDLPKMLKHLVVPKNAEKTLELW